MPDYSQVLIHDVPHALTPELLDSEIAGVVHLNIRVTNCFKAAEIVTLRDLAALEIEDLLKFRHFGRSRAENFSIPIRFQ